MISVENLNKCFGSTPVLDSVSFELAAGTLTALVGGNGAGKSTLLKIMSGAIPATSGEIRVGPEGASIRSVPDALRAGVRTSYQESSLIPAWSVAEHFPDWAGVGTPPWAGLAPHVRPSDRVERLDQAEQQAVEVARALAGSPRVVLADEPSAGLEPSLRTLIIAALQNAAARGSSVLWVTHDLEAALSTATRILVLRKGKLIRDEPAISLSIAALISDFSSSEGSYEFPARRRVHGQPATRRPPAFKLFGFPVQAGEVLGVVARSTAEVSKVLRASVGLPTGTLPARHRPRKPVSSIRYLSRERTTEWNFDRQDVQFNLTAGILKRQSFFGFRRLRKEREAAESLAGRFAVAPPSLSSEIEELSGGNRQKVVLARMASSDPSVLLLDEPFSGVDAPTRQTLANQLRWLASSGTAVVIYTQEVRDLLRCADRLVAIRDDGEPIEIEDWGEAEASIERHLSGVKMIEEADGQ